MKYIIIIMVLMLAVVGCTTTESPAEEIETSIEETDTSETEGTLKVEVLEEPEDTELEEIITETEEITEDIETVIIVETQSEVKEFIVTAKKWDFEPSTITVQEGDTVRLVVTSIDVDHGLAIPEFGVSERLTSGATTEVEFTADKKGTFNMFCNVFCGSGHGSMRGSIVVE